MAEKVASAGQESEQVIGLVDDVATLLDWLSRDVLVLVGGEDATGCNNYDIIVSELLRLEPRCEHRMTGCNNYDIIVSELLRLEPRCEHRIRAVRVLLANNWNETSILGVTQAYEVRSAGGYGACGAYRRNRWTSCGWASGSARKSCGDVWERNTSRFGWQWRR